MFYLGDCIESLFIEVESYRVVVMVHPALAATKSWKCNRQRVYCGNVQREVEARLNRSHLLRAPLRRKSGIASNIAKCSVWASDYIGPK